jgi:predicted transposase YdaD
MALPEDHPYRGVTLELLYNLQQNLRINQTIESEDRELIMRLAPLYQQEKERIQQESRQEGRQEGRQELILLWLTRKFGELNSLLIEQIQSLSVEQLDLLGEEVIDFSEIAQLETWLRNISQAARDQQST